MVIPIYKDGVTLIPTYIAARSIFTCICEEGSDISPIHNSLSKSKLIFIVYPTDLFEMFSSRHCDIVINCWLMGLTLKRMQLVHPWKRTFKKKNQNNRKNLNEVNLISISYAINFVFSTSVYFIEDYLVKMRPIHVDFFIKITNFTRSTESKHTFNSFCEEREVTEGIYVKSGRSCEICYCCQRS